MKNHILFLPAFWLLLIFGACQTGDNNRNKVEKEQPDEEPAVVATLSGENMDAAEARAVIADRAEAVMEAIAAQNYNQLATYVHPTQGLRFSPYAYIDTINNQVFTQEEVADLPDSKVRLWGNADGSGAPIQEDFTAYYQRYIYNKPYVKADTIGYNEPVSSGNIIYNYREIYPNCILVEYYLPGSEPQYNNMDWGSLIMIFTPHNGEWYLTNVAHGQWTI